MFANKKEKALATRAIAAKGYVSLAIQFEIYQPARKGKSRGYQRGSRIVKNLLSIEELVRVKQAVRDALEGL